MQRGPLGFVLVTSVMGNMFDSQRIYVFPNSAFVWNFFNFHDCGIISFLKFVLSVLI